MAFVRTVLVDDFFNFFLNRWLTHFKNLFLTNFLDEQSFKITPIRFFKLLQNNSANKEMQNEDDECVNLQRQSLKGVLNKGF